MADEKLYVKAPYPNIDGGDHLYIDRELGKIEIGFQKVEKAVSGSAVDADARDDIADVQRRVSTLEAAENNALALIEEERTVRANADIAEATARITLKAELDANSALLQQEQTARVTADEAFSQQLTTLSTDYNTNKASVTQQLTAVSTATSAQASALLDLEANVELNTAGLIEERIARIDEDEALSGRITLLRANFNDNTATVNSSLLALSTADSALTQSILNLTAVVDENVANIYDELTALATTDTSLSSRINTTSAVVGTKARTFFQSSAPVATVINPLTDGDLWFDVGNNNKIRRWDGSAWVDVLDPVAITSAAVANETLARVNADGVISKNVTTATTIANGAQATAQTALEAVDGVKAKWGVTLNNNGTITGIELNSGADKKSEFKIQADKFKLEPQGGATVSPFYVEENVTYIENAVIKNGSISEIVTANSAENDLTVPVPVKVGNKVTIIAQFSGGTGEVSGSPGAMYLHIDGTLVMLRPMAYYRFPISGNFYGNNQPTTYTYIWTSPKEGNISVWLANRPGYTGSGSALTIIVNKK